MIFSWTPIYLILDILKFHARFQVSCDHKEAWNTDLDTQEGNLFWTTPYSNIWNFLTRQHRSDLQGLGECVTD